MIVVEPYDPRWPERFEQLRGEYAHALAEAGVPIVAIEHVGSTSVPGLAAKPVIDCDIVVAADRAGAAAAVLVSLGFEPQGELGIPQRWAFDAPPRFGATNTYIVATRSLALRNHLAVRAVLRGNADLRDEYGRVKQELAATLDDIDRYTVAKSDILQRILAVAGLTPEELDIIAATNRLEVYPQRPGNDLRRPPRPQLAMTAYTKKPDP